MSSIPPAARPGHPYHMHDAIYAQPGALRQVGRHNGEAIAAAAARLRGVEHVWIAGIGTSWHAALVGELLLARVGGLGHRARALHTFELLSYWPPPGPRAAMVVVSHRGGRLTRAALERAHAGGAATIALAGKDAEGVEAADVRLTTVDPEASSTHTVSYTTALALLAALAAEVGGDGDVPAALGALPDQLALLLGQESWDGLIGRFDGHRRYWVVGGGPSTATAYEGAMKLSESSHVAAEGVHCEQFLHGPYAALEPGDLVVVVAPPGPAHTRCVDVARVAREVGAAVLALAEEDDGALGALATERVALPRVPELLSPIPAVVPLQLLAYHLALRRGRNPDLVRADEPAHGRARAAFAR
jgi:glucosamine--fructose-6-phosphate aminotransferase (isomerizing)